MSRIQPIIFLIAFSIVLFSCSKDAGSKNADTYIVSAESIINMTGKDWKEIEPQLKDKRGYWYTEFSRDQNLPVKAAISLPAIDDSNRTVKCNVLINVNEKNKVISSSMGAPDTTLKLNKNEAYAMMLNYNNQATKLLTQVVYTYAYYETSDGIGVKTTIDDILQKLSIGFEANALSIRYDTETQGSFSSSVFKDAISGDYSFGFDGHNL